MTKPSRRSLLGGLAVTALTIGMAIVSATSAVAADGQLAVRNNCGVELEYRVHPHNGGGTGYAFAGDIQYWNLQSATWYVSSRFGTKTVWVPPSRGVLVNLC
ncbi:hypothetical protein ACQPYE_25995 [Actinosynnema sp. CA-299493]